MSNTILIIVESPAKCKKIESFLGNNYKCIASFGHLRKLDSLNSIDAKNHYAPTFSLIESNKQIPKIKKEMSKCREVILATDDDREGEAIAWHICNIFSLPVETTKRIIFHEITKTAVCKAVENPTTINLDTVYAQQSRQILDILVGFKISPELWKNISWNSKDKLSAGRCQTPALRLIYDNNIEIKENPGKILYDTHGYFTSKNIPFELNHSFEEEKDVQHFLRESLQHEHIYSCSKIKKVNQSPPLPLITSSLQQQCNNDLHISPKDTMRICQKLYESGYITYMRTDSKVFSLKFIQDVKNYVVSTWGDDYVHKNVERLMLNTKANPKTKTKDSKNDKTQDAHEAIRPTNIEVLEIPGHFHPREKKVYKLIWRISCSACMSNCVLNSVTATITAPLDYLYKYNTKTVVFPGWKILVKDDSESEKNYTFCRSIKDIIIPYNKIYSKMGLKQLKSHYTEAKLVKLLEDNGIGRPSTFSGIVDKIQSRGYVKLQDIEGREIPCKHFEIEKEINGIKEKKEILTFGNEKKKLVIQPIGVIVLEFLLKYFSELFDYNYTKTMEDELDKIASGDVIWHELCKKCDTKINEYKNEIKSFNKTIKIDEENEYTIAKYGPVIKNTDRDGKVTFLNVKKNVDLEKLRNNEYTLEDVVEKREPKKSLGKYQNEDLFIKTGKFGLYAEWGKNKKSLSKMNNKNDVTLLDVINCIEQDTSIIRVLNDHTSIRKGKYGNYIFYKTKAMKKPKFIGLNKIKEDINIKIETNQEILEKINNFL